MPKVDMTRPPPSGYQEIQLGHMPFWVPGRVAEERAADERRQSLKAA